MKDGNPRDDAGSGGPSAGDDSAVATVASLMEERRQYEAWLAALDARRAETPKHVFSRVHADYTGRLESVIGRLTGQVEGLRTELTTLATRIATLEEQQHRARDERAEAELRAHVGEMTSAEWEKVAKKADAAIASLVEQHTRAEETLARTREFLADAERPATPPVSSAPIAAASAAPAPAPVPQRSTVQYADVDRGAASGSSAAPRLRPLPGREEPMPAPDAGRQGGNFDELAFLSSVVNEKEPPTLAAPIAPAVPSAPAAAAPKHPPTAPMKVEPVARPAPPPSRNPFAQRAQDKIINNDGAAGPQIESKKPGARSGLAANVSGNNPIVLRDKSNEAAKTLKCAECGAANYPTEWYCERCGAELASL